jgi:SAM-dependent methyltransferase
MGAPDADFYDRWYSAMARSSARDALVRHLLGLPAWFQSTGTLGWEALAEVVAVLALGDDQMVLDLACGRGGYGMEIVRRTGSRMVGVDFSSVAIRQARRRAEALGLAGRASFRVADMVDTGLDASSVDAVVCVDSIHFAEPVGAALGECRRVLKPGGRIVLTAWQFTEGADESFQSRARHRYLSVDLEAAGFSEVRVCEKAAWQADDRVMWQSVADHDPGNDPALCEMREEAWRILPVFDMRQRVLAYAISPT